MNYKIYNYTNYYSDFHNNKLQKTKSLIKFNNNLILNKNSIILSNTRNIYVFLNSSQINEFIVLKNRIKFKNNFFVKYKIPKFTPFQSHLFKNFNFKSISLNYFFFQKILFKGKFFKFDINEQKNFLEMYFGHSHNTSYNPNTVLIKNYHKRAFLVLYKNIHKAAQLTNLFVNLRPYSLYTTRGLRFQRSVIFKKLGKVSGNF